MDNLTPGNDQFESKDVTSTNSENENKDENYNAQRNNEVTSTQDDNASTTTKRSFFDSESTESEPGDDDVSKKKKRKDDSEKDVMGKSNSTVRGATGRVLSGTKPPGPASKTGVPPIGKTTSVQNVNKTTSNPTTGKSNQQNPGKSGPNTTTNKVTTQNTHQSKSKNETKGTSSSAQPKPDRSKSPVASPKPSQSKENSDDVEEPKVTPESTAPKVPPLKIVIPGGASGSGNRSGEQEGEGGCGQRGSGKGRGGSSTLPYVIPCTSTDTGPASDSSDGNSDDKRSGSGEGKGSAGQRVLRSHRTTDGEKEKDKDRKEQITTNTTQIVSSNKSPQPSVSTQELEPGTTSSGTTNRSESGSSSSVDLHPRKRKIKKDHSKDNVKNTTTEANVEVNPPTHTVTHANPYQMALLIKKQIERKHKSMFPVKLKPPKDFDKYLMNRCTYTLQSNMDDSLLTAPTPTDLNPQMQHEFEEQEKERKSLRVQHLVEKEKLVLSVEQEILRVHGRAERAVANQPMPFSACTILRDKEVYNVTGSEQEEKRNAQRSRCNGRQINAWLQEVDDKWERLKEMMLRRQNIEAESLHAKQVMIWEWKLKDYGLCEYKNTPKISEQHVPHVHVSNFDLPF
ncbi:Ankyrin repeat domain-containing protein 12 [Eumeta japonica]|uniref:Ankyrin repeat domain-containing protein 12 n=1 Tax=Eumeta variegata TaxID=151549 RepID=A0A4C1YGA6_EUMVA|nr:Ankyrin repeat domain-containing protein 12 [Eumeta japonica]